MVKDIKQQSDGDIDLSSGDLRWVDSTYQHQRDITLCQKGELKRAPVSGVGAANFLHDNNPARLIRAIRKELSRDGQTVNSVLLNNGGLEIDAHY
jgi:hypothetical protein